MLMNDKNEFSQINPSFTSKQFEVGGSEMSSLVTMRSRSNVRTVSRSRSVLSSDEQNREVKDPYQMQWDEFLISLKSRRLADATFLLQEKIFSAFNYNKYIGPFLRESSLNEAYHQQRFLTAIHRNQYKDHHNISVVKGLEDVTVDKIFSYIKSGDESGLNNFIAKQTAAGINWKEETDSAGANIIHLAYLFEKYELGHSLVKQFPDLALLPYSKTIPKEIVAEFEIKDVKNTPYLMPYGGENILHMVIIRRKYEEVKWLLNFFRDNEDSYKDGLRILLMQAATGYMFTSKGEFYFGTYPLHFAVCSNDQDIFDLVLRYTSCLNLNDVHVHHDISDVASVSMDGTASIGSNEQKDNGIVTTRRRNSSVIQELRRTSSGPHAIFIRDNVGNTALHLCVHHCLPDMFKHVYKRAEFVLRSEIRLLYLREIDMMKKAAQQQQHGEPKSFPLENVSDNYLKRNIGLMPIEKSLHDIPLDQNKYAEWINSETKMKLEERLLHVLNKDLHSPLTLAASRANHKAGDELLKKQEKMVRMLVESNMTLQWEYGPTRCINLSLEGLDIKYDVNDWYDLDCGFELDEQELLELENKKSSLLNPTETSMAELKSAAIAQKKKELIKKMTQMKSAIQWICEQRCYNSLKIPAIRKIIETKWISCGYPQLSMSFSFNIVTTAVITFILIFSNQSPAVVKYKHNKYVNEEGFTSFLYISLFCVALLRFKGAGIAKFDNTCQYLKSTSFLVTFAFKLVQAHQNHGNDYRDLNGQWRTNYVGFKIALVLCVLTSWMHMYYYLMAFDNTGPFVLTISRIVGKDVPHFMRFYLILVFAFACALSLLSNDGNPAGYYGFWQLLRAAYTLIQMTVNLSPTRNFILLNEVYISNQWLSDLLLTIYYIIVVILMLNLLIAMISSTYKRYHADNAEILLTEKNNIMDSNEQSMEVVEVETMNFYRQKYCTMETYYPKFNSEGRHKYSHHADDSDYQRYQFNFKLFETIPNWDQNSTPKKNEKFMLFIIDPQNDFHEGGALAVPNADDDSSRIADLIDRLGDQISDIFVSMDSHYPTHIAHAAYWKHPTNPNLKPKPFDKITFKDLVHGNWVPRDDSEENIKWVKYYTNKLQADNDKFTLTIWPEHCLVGSRGHAVVPIINSALQRWAEKSPRTVKYIMKGMNVRTEFYSALSAEVEDKDDPSTKFNYELLSTLETCDKLLICGQASSHCVNYTLRDIMSHWHGETSRIIYLDDCSSPVKGFSEYSEALKRDAASFGITITTSDKIIASVEQASDKPTPLPL
eukprot:gene10761-14452_t